MQDSLIPEMKYLDYFEPDTVKIIVVNSQHHGKVWQHTHGFFEFVYVDSGFSLHSYNGKTSILTAGDLFAIYPGEVHSYSRAFHTEIYNCLFYLDELGSLTNELLRLPGISREGKSEALPIIRVGLSDRRELVEILERMRTERKNKADGWELNMKGLLIRFLVLYSRLITEAKRSAPTDGKAHETDERGYHGYIYSALSFIEENYAGEITCSDIAKAAGLSSDYLTKQFKAVMSMTPTEYVRKFRIAKSMDLLRSTDDSIADIANAVGFGSISLYSRVFKQITGVSPAAFRKE